MTVKIRRRIQRMSWYAQAFVWPIYGTVWLAGMVSTLFIRGVGWGLSEMGGQAKRGAKKALAPTLWPLAIVGGVMFLFVVNQQAAGNLVFGLLVLAIMVGGAWIAIKFTFR